MCYPSHMPRVTYYVALPFVRDDEGTLSAGEAVECPNPATAIQRASAMVTGTVGAVAFSRTGDPDVGEFEPAMVLVKFGDVPDDLSTL
jgi:hypothetical protein